MCARDWPGPCVYCSAHTFGKRDKHIRNSAFSSLHLLHLPLASPSPSRRRSSAVCSSFLHLCPGFFLFRGLLSVALRAAELPALGCSPVLFSVSVPRWQPSHSPGAPPSPVCHAHLQALLWSFLFRRLVCAVSPSALLPSFPRSPVLYSVFLSRWQPRHQRWHVPFSLAPPSPLLSPALQLLVAPLCWCFLGEWGISSSCYRLGRHYTTDVAPAMPQKHTPLALRGICYISTSPMLYSNNPSTLCHHGVPVSTSRPKISFHPCAFCRHCTLVSVRTSCKYGKMWLVALHVLPWRHLPVSTPCMFYHWWPLIIKWLIINKLSGSQHSHCLTLAHLAEFKLIRVHLAAGCNFSLLEKQTAICLSCCPSPSVSLPYPPSN